MCRFNKILIFTLCLLFSSACSDILIEKTDNISNIGDFQAAWEIIDSVYPYLEFKKIDWDSIYTVYLPRAEAANGDEIFEVLLDMIFELKDAHMGIKAKGGVIPIYYQSPRRLRDQDLYSPYAVRKYVDDELMTTTNKSMNFGTIQNKIGYIRIAEFKKSTYEIDDVINYLLNTTGIIIDVRNNLGGYSPYADFVISRFINQTIRTPYAYRKGEEPSYSIIQPQGVYYNKPVVLLANGVSFSSAEYFTEIMKHISTVTFIGDTTCGGRGNPDWYNLPSGTKIRVSTTCYLNYDDEPVEWNGISPDYRVINSIEELENGKDNQLEYAINYIAE